MVHLILLALLAVPAYAARVTVNIEGLSKELEDAARANLTLQHYVGRDVTASQVRRLFTRGENEIRAGLQPYGYYNSKIDAALQTGTDTSTATFRVTPGDRAVVGQSIVKVTGDGADDPRVRRALRRFKPALGEPLDDTQYENSKAAVDSALYADGYLSAKQTSHRILVSRGANNATVEVVWDSGPRFKFGAVRFPDTQFPNGFLTRYIPWNDGEYFSSEQIQSLQQRLVDADYFSTVIVQPDIKGARDNTVPVDVTLQPAKRTIYSAGAYVSTDTGPGVRLGIQRRWVNTLGHKASFLIDAAQRQQQTSLTYQVPLPGPDTRSLNFGASYLDSDTATSKSRMGRLASNETRQWHGFTRTLGLQYLNGVFVIASADNLIRENHNTNLLYAEGTLTKRQADNPSFTRNGYFLGLTARLAPESPLTQTSFSSVQVDAKWILPPGRRQRLIFRTTLGAMAVKDFDVLPPELRFFAGGDRSIRGFDYEAIGERDANRLVIGGKYLVVGSAEYEYYFVRSWGVATFVDAGDAFAASCAALASASCPAQGFKLNVGAGVGVRWRSPVGVVRLDVGKPVKSDLAHSVRLHIQIGPDL